MPEDSPAGKLVHYASQPDGSGCVVADLDEGYPGCRVRRSFAVDYSGKSGAAALLVVRDTVTGPQEQAVWQMVAEVDTEVVIADNTVALKAAGGATLRATVLRPKQAVIEAVEQEHAFEAQYLDVHRNTKFARKVIRFSGTNDFLVVMTLQKGNAPPVEPRDGGGCNVGKRTVRLDGDQIAFD
jgi:hypothetical protein